MKLNLRTVLSVLKGKKKRDQRPVTVAPWSSRPPATRATNSSSDDVLIIHSGSTPASVWQEGDSEYTKDPTFVSRGGGDFGGGGASGDWGETPSNFGPAD